MKKIGIISYFNYYNYGSMLQGYALQKCISDMSDDVECEIINYRNLQAGATSKRQLLKIRCKRIIYYVMHLKEVLTKAKYAEMFAIRNTVFDAFLKTYTNTTKTFYRTKQQLVDSPPVYDIYITGSDQTWSPKVSGGYNETPMFLDFAISGARKAAYAPCLGVVSLTVEQKLFLKEKLKSYSLISCREVNGSSLLSQITGQVVPAVVDPTLLLTAKQWREIMVKPKNEKKYIFCYFLGDRHYYRDFAKQLSKQTGLPLYYLPVNWREFSDDANRIWNAGPREFVGLIEGASYVCTDSFHGVAFSCNLNKDFFAFVKHVGKESAGDNSRIFDFLERVGLQNRLLTSYDGGLIDTSTIDYNNVNKTFAAERAKAYSFINKIINL